MSAREWQPGDVALVGYDGEPERVMLRAEVERAHGRRACWLDSTYRIYDDQGRVQSIRPLVVLDPDDRDQVEQLLGALHLATGGSVISLEEARFTLLRMIPSLHPSEPRGLGAVVENAKGHKFVRVADPIDGWAHGKQWQRIGGELNTVRNFGWSQIEAVRVLSEGIQ